MQGPETRASLIGRLSDSTSSDAWGEFAAVYRPLILRVARAKGLQQADAEDLAQEVLSVVSRAVGSFDLTRDGSFRGWLFTITRNLCVNQLTRNRGPVGSGDSDMQRMLLELPADEATVTLFTLEHRRLRFRQAAEKVQAEFEDATWQSFWQSAVEGRPIADVARELGRSEGSVRVARCRVLNRIRRIVQTDE